MIQKLLVQFDEEGREQARLFATTLTEIAEFMKNANYGSWIAGLGQPSCWRDLQLWKETGKFLLGIAEVYGEVNQ